MAEQLKIVIDADVSSAVSGIQNLSKVISTDFTRATNAATTASANLSGAVTASVQKINAALSSLKVTSLDISVNTASIDASIQDIKSKFNALVDPELNVLANTAQAEVKIKELLADLSSLKSSEVFITANDSQALQKINEVEVELRTLSDKQIQLNVNTSDATNKINLLEKELADLQGLSIQPNISTTQLSIFEANIKRIKAELASLKGQGLVIPIEASTTTALNNLNKLGETIETLRAKAEAKKFFITVETDVAKIAAYNKEIQSLESRVRQLQNIGKKGFEIFAVPGQTINSVKSLTASVAAFGGGVRSFIPPAIAQFNKLPSSITPIIGSLKALEKQAATSGAATANAFSKAFGGLRSLAALIPGIGLGGLIGLAATAVNSLTEGFFEAAFGASKLDKAIDAAAGSIDKNAASVVVMVRALQSGTLSSSEFRKVKAELIAQAPEFQKSFDGDKIKILESEAALQTYTKQLTTTIRVSAALSIVNDLLAKSIATIAKGGTVSVGEKITNLFAKLNPLGKAVEAVDFKAKSLNEALESLAPENITKLIDDTFKKLGITFEDFAGTIDDKALKDSLAKISAAFEKFQTETITRARQFTKEFGNAFVLPNLEDSFFKNKDQLFKEAKNVLNNVRKFIQGNQQALQIKIPVNVEATQIRETITQDIQKLNQLIGSIKPLKLVTEGDFKEVEKQLSELENKEIILKIDQRGDVTKIAEQLSKLKGVEIPITINDKVDVKSIIKKLESLKGVDLPVKITGDVDNVVKELSKIEGIKLSVSGDTELNKIIERLKSIQDKEITISIDQTGDISKIADQLTKLKGIKIPITIEQQGDIQKIATELKSLKSIDIKITGDAKNVLTELSKIKDVTVSVKLDEQGALDRISELTKGENLTVFVDEKGIQTQIVRGVDGAIKVVQTKEIRIPVVTDADIKIAEQLAKEVELSQSIIDNFFNGIKAERHIPVEIIPDLTLSKQALADIDKKLNLRQQFKIFGDLGFKEFGKIDFSNITKGISDATRTLQGMLEVATTLQQSIGQGLTGAFNAVFDSILEGKSVFKALGNAIKELVVGVIKAVAQMLILKAVTSLIFPGAGGAIPQLFGSGFAGGGFGGQANLFGLGQQIGNRSFQNTLQVAGDFRLAGQDLLLSITRAGGSNSR